MDHGSLKVFEGKPAPLGVSRHGCRHNFAIHTGPLKALSLLIYNDPFENNYSEIRLLPEINRKKETWCIAIEGLPDRFSYQYKIVSKNASGRDSDPLLLNDPFARIYSGAERWGRQEKTVSRRSYYCDQPFDWGDDCPLRIPLSEMVIYELHVRGFTRHPSSAVSTPGTFSGLAEKIPYLTSLGINAVELLPLCEFDETLVPRKNPLTGEKLLNFWGYDPLGYFAPKSSYAAIQTPGAAITEFKQMVKDFHRAGIEVILDVVYNHTGEGPAEGMVFSFRGLDEKTYYMLDPQGHYRNFTGCGNTVNCNHPVVQKMILDSLRYWVEEMHIDGFRFDLASILSRARDGSVHPNPPILEKINKDPVLSGVKLIAEAWDAAGLYQVGSFPGGAKWSEWNDKFRDTIRRFVRGDQYVVPELATRLAGSSDLYQHSKRTPLNSINYITCHDGFTLFDLVSFSRKRNRSNGEDNRDGLDENYSANYGKEGPSARTEINRLRIKQVKNMVTFLMIAQGIPMLLAGDEFGRSQQGNNNAYCQDNEISWLDWNLLEKNTGQFRFFQLLIRFRMNHPTLRRGTFFIPDSAGNSQIVWYNPGLQTPDWFGPNATIAFHLIPFSGDSDIYTMANNAQKNQLFLLPVPSTGKKWYLSLNTAKETPEDIAEPGMEPYLSDQKIFLVEKQSTVVLIAK